MVYTLVLTHSCATNSSIIGLSYNYETVTYSGLLNVCEGLLSLGGHQRVIVPQVNQYPQGSSLLHLGGLLSLLVSVTQILQMEITPC